MKAQLQFVKMKPEGLFGLIKPGLNCLALIENVMLRINQALLITCPITSQQPSVLVAALVEFCSSRYWESVRVEEKLNVATFSHVLDLKACSTVVRTSD